MGILLPVYGYVAQRGSLERHRRDSEDGGWNKRHKNKVQTFIDSLREIYPSCPVPGRFMFPQGSKKRRAFGDVLVEKNNHTRITLCETLLNLQIGGTIVVTNMNHLLDEDKASVELMLKFRGTRIAFLAIDESPVKVVNYVEDVQSLIDHLTYSFCNLKDKTEDMARSLGIEFK